MQSCNESNPPALSFTRKMSKISIAIIRKESNLDAVLSNLSLSGVVTDGTFAIINNANNRESGSVVVGQTTSDISLFENESNLIEAIIIPQTTTSSTLNLKIDNGIYPMALYGTFAENTQYSYTLTIGTNLVELSGATITGWDEVESVDLSQNVDTFTAGEIDADNIPTNDVWVITDEGEVTQESMSGVMSALSAVSSSGRKITIIMPNATSVGEKIFYGSEADYTLASIELPNVISIGERAFYNINTLSTVKMPKVEKIGENAFERCLNLTTISDLSGVTSIGEYAFCNCYALTTDIKLPLATELPAYVFYNCTSLTSVEIPKVETIGESAFEKCTSLTTISDLSGVTSIGEYAFYCCSALTTDIKLHLITELPAYVFYNCTSLTSVEIPKVETIDMFAFSDCFNLTTISDLSGVTSIGEWAFNLCYALEIEELYLPNVTTIPAAAFYCCEKIKSINMPNVEYVETSALCAMQSLTEVELPKATTLGVNVFAECQILESISLPAATSIGNYAFADTPALTTLKLTSEDEISCGIDLFYISDDFENDASGVTLYLNSNKSGSSIANLTDGTYTFADIIYSDSTN